MQARFARVSGTPQGVASKSVELVRRAERSQALGPLVGVSEPLPRVAEMEEDAMVFKNLRS